MDISSRNHRHIEAINECYLVDLIVECRDSVIVEGLVFGNQSFLGVVAALSCFSAIGPCQYAPPVQACASLTTHSASRMEGLVRHCGFQDLPEKSRMVHEFQVMSWFVQMWCPHFLLHCKLPAFAFSFALHCFLCPGLSPQTCRTGDQCGPEVCRRVTALSPY